MPQLKLLPSRAEYKRQQELHVLSQQHAEWVVKQMLKRLRMLRELYGWDRGETEFMYLRAAFSKAYRVQGDHQKYVDRQIDKQLTVEERE